MIEVEMCIRTEHSTDLSHVSDVRSWRQLRQVLSFVYNTFKDGSTDSLSRSQLKIIPGHMGWRMLLTEILSPSHWHDWGISRVIEIITWSLCETEKQNSILHVLQYTVITIT